MKKVIALLSLILLTASVSIAKSTDSSGTAPKLTLKVYFAEPSDTTFLESIRTSKDICDRYDFMTIKSEETKILVCSGDTQIGVIYGYPSEKFILDIYRRIFGT
jgi:hypothetical protein